MSPRPDLAALADDITAHAGYVRVLDANRCEGLPHSCASIVAGQEAGHDPTGWWREAVARAQERRYRVTPPPQVAATFVLGWYLQVVAVPLAFASVLRDWLPDASPSALHFDLHEQEFYPVAQTVGGGSVTPATNPRNRLAVARTAYEEHAHRFVESYRPGVKMSSKQRYGMVRDTWAAIADSARTSVSEQPSALGPRESCCFLFALPGDVTCARCPRRRS